jgi:hypothetical protein
LTNARQKRKEKEKTFISKVSTRGNEGSGLGNVLWIWRLSWVRIVSRVLTVTRHVG